MKKQYLIPLFSIMVLCSGIIYALSFNGSKNQRYEKGWQKLKEIDGHAGEQVIESLADISPDLGNYIIEYVFGDVYTRTNISDKEREVAVISALTAMGNAAPQLKVHLNAALNTGCTPNEVVQVINQTSPYGGIPASLNALAVFREVIIERGIDYKASIQVSSDHNIIISDGIDRLNALRENQHQILQESLSDISPDMTQYITYTYGSIINEDALAQDLRIIATIASLTAKGTATPQLRLYIDVAITNDISPEKIREIMITVSAYAGFPAALNGIFLLKEVLQQKGLTIETK